MIKTPIAPAGEWIWVPFTVDKQYDGYRIDRFLSSRLAAYSRSRVQRILDDGRIQKDGRSVRASSKVRFGDQIFIAYPRRPEEPLSEEHLLEILFEDDHYLIVNKPADLLSHPTDKVQLHTVTGILKHQRPDLKIHLLHRLDRDTSGVLALGKTSAAARSWTDTMEKRLIQKTYLALVSGIPEPREGVIDLPIGHDGGEIRVRQTVNGEGSVAAITHYHVLKVSPPSHTLPLEGGGSKGGGDAVSLVQALPKTGRLHQIRVHLASIGHPILGDALYQGNGRAYLKMIDRTFTEADQTALGFPRVALHAAALEFTHAFTKEPLRVEAPLPEDFRAFLDERFEIAKLTAKRSSPRS